MDAWSRFALGVSQGRGGSTAAAIGRDLSSRAGVKAFLSLGRMGPVTSWKTAEDKRREKALKRLKKPKRPKTGAKAESGWAKWRAKGGGKGRKRR